MKGADRPGRPGLLLRLQLLCATGLGVGYAPLVPGTFGSALGVLLFVGLHAAGSHAAVLTGILGVTLIGLWSAGPAARHFDDPDPRAVVVDEIAGQMVALALLVPTPGGLALGFFVFRVLDVIKPFPANRLERLPGASGIMADDLAAGVYANLLLRALYAVASGWLG